MKKRLSESLALSILSKHGIDVKNKVIIAKNGVRGLSACSAMDYLHNYCNYVLNIG